MTPFAIVDTLGWLTPAGIFVLSLLFLAVDEIGAEIEDPFGSCKYPTVPLLLVQPWTVSILLALRARNDLLREPSCLRAALHMCREKRPHSSG